MTEAINIIVKKGCTSLFLLFVILLAVFLLIIVTNQYAGLKQMRSMQRSLDDINQKLRDMQGEK